MNKPASHPFHKRYPYGKQGEMLLKSTIEQHLGETITPTASEYDTVDFTSPSCLIELKRRSNRYSFYSNLIQQGGLILPAVKIDRARSSDKTVYFYYYFDADSKLFYWKFNWDEIKTVEPVTPSWHIDRQLSYFIPSNLWKLVD